jgi:signal transduction histidine kinase
MMTVFRNIFSNAIKFTKMQGQVTIFDKIQRSPPDDTEMMEISEKDSGAGLSPATLLRLFGEGVQFNANSLQGGGGSGLGLFITKGQ